MTNQVDNAATRKVKSNAKYKYMGEDHLQGSVRLVFTRKEDGRVFIVDEAALQDQQGYGVPPEIHQRLHR